MTTETETASAKELCVSLGIRNFDVETAKKETEEKIASLKVKLEETEKYLSELDNKENAAYLDQAIALVDTLRNVGLNDDAVAGALAKQFPSAAATVKATADPGTVSLDDKGRETFSELTEDATSGFTIAAICREMLPYKQADVRKHAGKLASDNEIVNVGGRGKGAKWYTITNLPDGEHG